MDCENEIRVEKVIWDSEHSKLSVTVDQIDLCIYFCLGRGNKWLGWKKVKYIYQPIYTNLNPNTNSLNRIPIRDISRLLKNIIMNFEINKVFFNVSLPIQDWIENKRKRIKYED